jgi:calcium-dependent protein kinase
MHRDLKPENILFSTKGDLDSQRVADFGLSAFVDDVPYLFPKCGTPGFVAPESNDHIINFNFQVVTLTDKNQPYGCECDIFSAGVIFHILYEHHLLTYQIIWGRNL